MNACHRLFIGYAAGSTSVFLLEGFMRRSQFALAVVVMAGSTLAAQVQYAKVAEIPIGGAGAWDYATVDSAGKRLYVSHGTEVVVIDTSNNTVAGRITDTPGVHGMAVVPELGRVFVTNGRGN